MKISIIVTLKKEVLDPQGKVILQTLENTGFKNVNNIRQGKYFEIDIDDKNFEGAKSKAKEICESLLSNPVIEDYKIIEKI